MIERFNFYDIYGYLIPGVVTVLLLTLPSAWFGGLSFESNEWTILIVGVVLAYVVGHMLQTIASTALPSSRDRAREPSKYYSTTLLNPDNSAISPSTKQLIQAKVSSRFSLMLSVDKEADKEIGAVRQDAFNLCRHALSAKSNYSEQFEGMYTMMRGLTTALWLASAYTVGYAIWGVVVIRTAYLAVVLVVSVLSFLAIAIWLWSDSGMSGEKRFVLNRVTLCSLLLTLLIIGYCAAPPDLANSSRALLAVVVALYLAASFRFLNGYYFFAQLFAKTVWLQFAAQDIHK